jgi:hypothetical protein
MAVAALVLGIVAVVLFFSCGLGVLCGILALVFGFIGLGRAKTSGQGRGLSLAGIVLGAIGVIGGILFIVLIAFVGNNVDDALGSADPDDYEIEPQSCGIDADGYVTFEGTIENTAGRDMDFVVLTEIRDTDEDVVLREPTTIVSVSEGDTTRWEVTAYVDQGANVECSVDGVDDFFN